MEANHPPKQLNPKRHAPLIQLVKYILLADVVLTAIRGIDFMRYVTCVGVDQACGFTSTALLAVFFWFALAGFSWWLWVVWKKLLDRDKPQIWKQALITIYTYLLFQATFLLFLDSLSFIFKVESLISAISAPVGIGITLAIVVIIIIPTIVALRREKKSKLV